MLTGKDQIIQYTIGDREVLVRLDQKMDDLLKALEKPYPRCAANMERINSLESSRKWAKGTTTIFSLGFLTMLMKWAWSLLTNG
jgi:ArsR family metal-binding transcriptional regulator